MRRLGWRGVALLWSFCWFVGAPAWAQDWGQPVWADEFDGARGAPIDAKKWTYETGILHVNDEVEYYCAPAMQTGGCQPSNPNAYLDGKGHLVIQAIRLNASAEPNSGSWTSARLVTNGLKTFQYGRVEARMSLPIGPGVWPAFWALGNDIGTVGWPTCGEQDYMENVPATVPSGNSLGPDVIASTLHANSPKGSYNLGGKLKFESGDVTGMHAYGAIWSPGMIQFYVDDPKKVFFVGTASDMKDGQAWAFEHPYFLLLNLAMGGKGSWPGQVDATTPSPAVMTVDYVRIYKAAAIPAPSFANAPVIQMKAGATKENSAWFRLAGTAGSGRMYLTCAFDAPNGSCTVRTNDALNPHTVDFGETDSAEVNVTVTAPLAGSYTAAVNVFTVSGNGRSADTRLAIPVTVN